MLKEGYSIQNVDSAAIRKATIEHILKGPRLDNGNTNFLYTEGHTGKRTRTTLQLARGTYYMWVTGNDVITHRTVVVNGDTSVHFDVRNTYANVRSNPPGARILLDNKDTGIRTPALITVPMNKDTRLSVAMDGYYSAFKNVKGIQGDTEEINFELREVEYGNLNVSTVPNGAMVYINGKEMGTSPLQNIKVVANRDIVIESRKKGYTSVKETVQVSKDSNKQVHQTLLLPKTYRHINLSYLRITDLEGSDQSKPALGLAYGALEGESLFGTYGVTAIYSTLAFNAIAQEEGPIYTVGETPDIIVWDNTVGLGLFPSFKNASLFVGAGVKMNLLVPSGISEPAITATRIGFGYEIIGRLSYRISPKFGLNASISSDSVTYYRLRHNRFGISNLKVSAGITF